jgi:hypothetical protein
MLSFGGGYMKAVTFNRILLIVCMLVVSSSCSGENDTAGIATLSHELSLASFEKAKRELENAIEACDRNRKIVSPSLITPFGMDIKDTQLALYVLNRRAEEACENGARERLFYAANKHIKVAEHYGLKAGDAQDYSGDLLFLRHWEFLELEVKYLKLNEETRSGLESISELQEPFFLFKTVDGIKASMTK